MRYPVLAALLVLWLAAGCGKVGEPHPPAIRIPAKILDLKAAQNQSRVVLSWTNPAKYVDGSIATDLAEVRIFQDGMPLAPQKLLAPGKPQMATLDVNDAEKTIRYTLEVVTTRGKISEDSNPVSIQILHFPGVVLNLAGIMDQHRIRLSWQAPDRNPELAETYIIRREDGAIPEMRVKETHFEDANVEEGKTYSYVVTAARGTPPVPGPASAPKSVLAMDKTRPAPPAGLQPPVVSGAGAVLQWDPNTETDIAGYRIYRSNNPDSGFVQLDPDLYTITSTRDPGYMPGFYYKVSAQDDSGNESAQSSSVHAP